ncbi:MAG: dephospho-CoA kinase [Acidobacteria bacterium]|nr:MAG: dephospho-CoA kinase [Acidobacteriota bacterium]
MSEPWSALRERRALVAGLTGGIATGKSTVAGMLRELGVPVIDADALVHELLDPGGAGVEPVVDAFGREVLAPDGGVDRQRLAGIVFADDERRRELERIMHPLVLAESARRIDALIDEQDPGIVVYDAALLVETGRHRDFPRLIVVTCPVEQQIERLRARDGLDVDAAGARIRSQLPTERKVALADYVIDNSGPWTGTRHQVAELVERLREDAAAWRAGRELPAR